VCVSQLGNHNHLTANKINRHAMLSLARRKTVYSRIIRLDPAESMRTASTSVCGSFAQAFHNFTSVILGRLHH
jgi:hypothetical protein